MKRYTQSSLSTLSLKLILLLLKTLRVVEQELHIELIPGTEIMADIGTHHFVKSTGHSGKVLVPQPSSDPHDPLV